jgi:ElaB/YqjD/DUF883 family membrane-anchored ribosome-binding protein
MGSQMFGGWTGSARESMRDAREAVGEAGDVARRGYDQAAHRARDAYEQASDYIDPYRQTFEDAIVSNPVKAVAASLAVGVLLGWLIKRS